MGHVWNGEPEFRYHAGNGLAEERNLSQSLDVLRHSVKTLITWRPFGLDREPEPEADQVAEARAGYGAGEEAGSSITEFWRSLFPEDSLAPSVSMQVLRALAFIHERYAEPILVENIAACADLSRYHFIRRFKGETGLTPHAYLIQLRLSHARRMLLSRPDLKVREVGAHVGYADPTAFARLFRDRVGMSPLQYRQDQLRLLLRRRKRRHPERE